MALMISPSTAHSDCTATLKSPEMKQEKKLKILYYVGIDLLFFFYDHNDGDIVTL